MDDKICKSDRFEIAEVAQIIQAQGRSKSGPSPETSWKRAFIALALVIAGEWTTSDQLSHYVNVVRVVGGEEPAQFLTQLFLRTRSKFMQGLMG